MLIILHRSCNGFPFKHMCTQLLYGTIHPSIFSILNGPYKQFRWLTDWLGFWLLPAVVGHCHPYEYGCMGRVLYYMCICESSCEWVCDCVCVARSQCTLGEFVDFLLWLLFVQSFIRSVFLLFFFFLLLLRLRLRLLSHLLFGVCTHTMFILSTGKTELNCKEMASTNVLCCPAETKNAKLSEEKEEEEEENCASTTTNQLKSKILQYVHMLFVWSKYNSLVSSVQFGV